MSYGEAVAIGRKGVVRIETDRSQGSGTVIARKRILTNAHVVGSAATVKVASDAGETVTAQVIWRDRATDLAVAVASKPIFDPLPVSDLAGLREGDEVIALGHPLGLGFSVTRGIVSCRSRSFRGQEFIQTDAAINPGNSGGALLDVAGRLIGINTFLLQGQGLNFAIPIDRALSVVGQALKGSQLKPGQMACAACQSFTPGEKPYCESCGTRLQASSVRANPAAFAREAIAASRLTTPPYCHACGSSLTTEPYCSACGSSVR
jgi:S1-C subfamily serine protease